VLFRVTMTKGFDAVLPCRAALWSRTLTFTARGDPPLPQADRLCLAQAQPGRQALLVPAYRRRGETFDELAAGFGVGTATAWRYVTETVSLLAARSPEGQCAGCGQGRRAPLRGDRRHVNPGRPTSIMMEYPARSGT
jgi:Helix-turn-helix of DDE superfamily endonuclease